MLTAEGVAALLKVKEQKLAAPESLIMSDYLTQERTINRSCIGGQLILNRYGIKKFIEAAKILYGCPYFSSFYSWNIFNRRRG